MSDLTCELPDCDKPRYQNRAMCGSHFMKMYRHGDPYYRVPRRISDMTGRTFGALTVLHFVPDAGWYCICDCGNYRTVRAGELNAGRATSCGDTRTHWRHDTVGYSGMHSRVRVERGSATQHACVDCGRRAEQWAYDHNDSNEQVQNGLPYGTEVHHYSPRCVPCHKRLDLQHVALRALDAAVDRALSGQNP